MAFIIRINFLDGTYADINHPSTLLGIDNARRRNNEEPFYLQIKYDPCIDEGGALYTSDERLGVMGFILSHDCFALDADKSSVIYKSSAVKSVEII